MTTGDPYDNPNSLRFRMRKRRFEKIARRIDDILDRQERCRIIDIGGTEQYWRIADEYLRKRAGRIEIVLVNLDPAEVVDHQTFSTVIGDACDLSEFADNSFDLVHSNSLIEHVGCWENMKRSAAEVRRLAPHYYVQTPYFWFPLEPHYNRFAFHWLPQCVQASRIRNRRHGFIERAPDIDAAMSVVQHTTLLDAKQFAYLFPDAELVPETIFGLTKSLIASR